MTLISEIEQRLGQLLENRDTTSRQFVELGHKTREISEYSFKNRKISFEELTQLRKLRDRCYLFYERKRVLELTTHPPKLLTPLERAIIAANKSKPSDYQFLAKSTNPYTKKVR